MKGLLRTLVIWLALFGSFSVYNVPSIIANAPSPPGSFKDPKVVSYNFSMAQPVVVQGNFTSPVTISKSGEYFLRVYVWKSFNLSSSSAYGQEVLNYTIYTNGVKMFNSTFSIVWSHEYYGLSAAGPTPDYNSPGNFANLRLGLNPVEFRFTLSQSLTVYGAGSFRLSLGPFTANVTSSSEQYQTALVLEGVVGLVLVPLSHVVGVGLQTTGRRRRTPRLDSDPTRT